MQSNPLEQDAPLAVVTFEVATDCGTSGIVTRRFEPEMPIVCKAERVTISDTTPEEPLVCTTPVNEAAPVLAPFALGSGFIGMLPTAVLACMPVVTVAA
jgi:hypothetical protein